MGALDLLSGDAQTFLAKVWASRVHLHRTDPALLVGLLSLDDVDHLLTETAIRTPAIRIAQDGAVLPEAAYTRSASLAGRPLTGLVDARKVAALFDGGATVVLQGVHRYWAPLTRLVADLEVELGHPCQANAYLTPPGSQGFAVHSDSHDVFVFQTHGTKLWEVHHGEYPGGREEVLLEPGLSMYLPTGTPHAARAQEGASLHVTLGINQLTWRGLLRRTVERLVAEVPDDHLPAGYLDDPSLLVGAAGRPPGRARGRRTRRRPGRRGRRRGRAVPLEPADQAAWRSPRRARRRRPLRRHSAAPAGGQAVRAGGRRDHRPGQGAARRPGAGDAGLGAPRPGGPARDVS